MSPLKAPNPTSRFPTFIGWIFLAISFVLGPFLSFHWVRQAQDLAHMELLDAAQVEKLEVGDRVWFEGSIGDEDVPYNDLLMYGCEVGLNGDETIWNRELSYLNEPIPLRDPDISMTVHLEEGCPNEEGEYWWGNTHSQVARWKGYQNAQALSIIGEVRTVEPLVVDASQHFGGRAAVQVEKIWGPFYVGLCISVGAFLIGAWWVFIAHTRFWDRWGWESFAEDQGLVYSRRHYWTPGRMEGAVRGRSLRFSQREGIGNKMGILSDSLLRIRLNPRMEPYRLRRPYPLENRVFHPNASLSTDNPFYNTFFVFKGVDPERWSALLSEPGVERTLLELQRKGFSVAMKDGWLILHWKGFETDPMEPVLERALVLADALEQAEAETWRRAAKALKLDFKHSAHRWRLSAGSKNGPRLVYARTDRQGGRKATGWTSTFESRLFELSIQQGRTDSRCLDWQIEPRDPARPGSQTGDPILDAHLSFQGFQEADLQSLVRLEDATPILMAALVAHDIRLEKGCLKMQKPGFLAEPQAIFEDIARLEDLLLLAVG